MSGSSPLKAMSSVLAEIPLCDAAARNEPTQEVKSARADGKNAPARQSTPRPSQRNRFIRQLSANSRDPSSATFCQISPRMDRTCRFRQLRPKKKGRRAAGPFAISALKIRRVRRRPQTYRAPALRRYPAAPARPTNPSPIMTQVDVSGIAPGIAPGLNRSVSEFASPDAPRYPPAPPPATPKMFCSVTRSDE